MKHLWLIFILWATIPAFGQEHLPPIERFHTYEEMTQELQAYANDYPDLCILESIGQSLEGRELWALKISDNPQIDEDEPAILIDGLIHAEEIYGVEISMMLIDNLLTGYGENDQFTNWVDHTEIWIVPDGNPDGHQVVMDGIDICYRKNKRDNNENGEFDYSIAECPGVYPDVPCFINDYGHPECTLINESDIDGVDLNRNFDWAWYDTPDTNWASEYFVGTAPFSEPEAAAMADLAREVRPTFALIYHSSRSGNLVERVVFPWRDDVYGSSPDYRHLEDVARRMARLIPADGGIGTYVHAHCRGDKGYAQNWFYAELGTFAFEVEVAICCNIQSRSEIFVESVCQRNLEGVYYLLDRLRQDGVLTGVVRNAETHDVIPGAHVKLVGVDNDSLLTPRYADVHGRYRRILKLSPSSVYTLEVSHPGYDTATITDIQVTPDSSYVEIDIDLIPGNLVEPEMTSPSTPAGYFLNQNFPNPFNPMTIIRYGITKPAPVSLKIYNLEGQLVKNLVDKHQFSGTYSVVWDGTDDQNRSLPSGVYIYHLRSDEFSQTQQAILLK